MRMQVLTAEDDHDEARMIAEGIKKLLAEGQHPEEQVAVLYRTHMQSRLIEQEMVSGDRGLCRARPRAFQASPLHLKTF